jgi:hypothetical protein
MLSIETWTLSFNPRALVSLGIFSPRIFVARLGTDNSTPRRDLLVAHLWSWRLSTCSPPTGSYAGPMVKIRVTVTVIPEDVYLAAQHLTSAVRSSRTRKIPVTCESPETWTIGQFANKIKDAYSKTYGRYAGSLKPANSSASFGGSSLTILLVRDLGIIKYIKDEDDADLHADLSVYDALG